MADIRHEYSTSRMAVTHSGASAVGMAEINKNTNSISTNHNTNTRNTEMETESKGSEHGKDTAAAVLAMIATVVAVVL